MWQRGRACLGQGLDKLICSLCTVAFRRLPPLLSLRRDDGNWIRRTNFFIFLDGRVYVSFGAVIFFVCAANLLAFLCPCPCVNHFLALKPDRNMTAILQTAQRHRHFLKVSKEEGILSCLFSVQPWIETRDLLRPHDSSAVCVKYTYILGMISNFFFRPSLSVRHRGKIRECQPQCYHLDQANRMSALLTLFALIF